MANRERVKVSGILLLVGNVTKDDYFGYESTLQEYHRKRNNLRFASIRFDAEPALEGSLSGWFDRTLRSTLRVHKIASKDVCSVVGDEHWAVYLEDHGFQADLEKLHFPNLKLLYVVRVGNNGERWFEDIFSPGPQR